MDAVENQKQVSHRVHSPWKSQRARFPHFHRLGYAWKSGKPKAGFPLSHLLFLLKNPTQKGGLAADRFAPAFRLILGLENAYRALSIFSRPLDNPAEVIESGVGFGRNFTSREDV